MAGMPANRLNSASPSLSQKKKRKKKKTAREEVTFDMKQDVEGKRREGRKKKRGERATVSLS